MNRSLISLLSLGLLSLAAAVSCSSSDEKDPYATADDFCAAWSERACITEVVDNCSQEGGEKAACRKSQKSFCKALLGDKKYRRDPVEQCLEFVKDAYSDAKLDADEAAVVLRLGPPCAQVVGMGGKLCESSKDCDDGGLCEETSSGVGVCKIGGGRSCDPGGKLECASQFYCSSDEYCVERRGSGDTCATDGECASNQICEVTVVEADPEADPPVEASTSGSCVRRLATDAECTKDDECESRWCSDGTCTVKVVLSAQSSICDDLQ